jgi:hypothetical protein
MIQGIWKRLGLVAVITLAGGISMAAAEPETTTCGASIRSVVKTDFVLFSTSSTTFANLPGAAVAVTVPPGETQCVKVRFSAEVRCMPSASADLCAVRVLVPDLTLFLPGVNGVTFASEQGSATGTRSFQWVQRLFPGTHVVRVQAGVQNAATNFEIQAWTLDVESTKSSVLPPS